MATHQDPCLNFNHEDLSDFDLTKTYTNESMLEQVRGMLPNESKLLERKFINPKAQLISSENGINGHAKCTVKVMTFNILAQGLSLGADNFVLCPVPALVWKTRRYRLLEEILLVDPDVLCLQEVDHFHFFQVLLGKIGYEGSFFPKPSSPCLDHLNNNGPDGCAMFYKTDKLDLIQKQNVILKRKTGALSNQVSVMYKMKCKDTNDEFCVATTHLKAKAGHDQLRFEQGTDLLKESSAFSNNSALIICGDFNASPNEKVIQTFKDKSSTLTSSYTALSESGLDEPRYTTWKFRGGKTPSHPNQEACRTIDYMWYRSKYLHVQSLLSIPTESEIGPGRLPSWSYPSDHFSLAAVFSFI